MYENGTNVQNFSVSQTDKTLCLIWNIQHPRPPLKKPGTSSFLAVLERWGAAATAENCWGVSCEEKHNASKLSVSLETKINKYLTPSECICTYCEICFKELAVQLGNHSCLLLFEISLVFPVQLHLCVKLPPPGDPFSLPLGYLLLSSCVAYVLLIKSLISFTNHTFVMTQSELWPFVLWN